MSNVRAERSLRRLQRIKTWQLVLLLILMLLVTATFLRLNNIGMIQRRDAVLSADKQNDPAVLRERLYDLQRYVATHMNASSGVIYLTETYTRDWEASQEAARAQNQSGSSDENIYKKIEDEVCGPLARANGWRWPDPRYIACQREELAKYPGGAEIINQLEPPNKQLYRHSFASPLWSPDFAGFSAAVCLLIIVVIIARLIGLAILKLMVRHHYKSI